MLLRSATKIGMRILLSKLLPKGNSFNSILINWTSVTAEYLSTYHKVIPEIQAKQSPPQATDGIIAAHFAKPAAFQTNLKSNGEHNISAASTCTATASSSVVQEKISPVTTLVSPTATATADTDKQNANENDSSSSNVANNGNISQHSKLVNKLNELHSSVTDSKESGGSHFMNIKQMWQQRTRQ
jgi:hypothetical protein